MKKLWTTSQLVLIALLLTSCLGGLTTSDSTSTRETGTSDSTITNSPSSLKPGYGRIFADNPYILNNNSEFTKLDSFNSLLKEDETVFISNTGRLQGNCEGYYSSSTLNNCFEVYKDESSAPLINQTSQWGYNANSSEFLQVHTFGHLQLLVNRYHSLLQDHFESTISTTSYRSAVPINLYTTSGERHWRLGSDRTPQTLTAYSEYDIQDNAFFSRSTFELAFGKDALDGRINLAQDPTIIYHESGHALVNIMMNMRNDYSGTIVERSALKSRFYDEAGALNEGIADYFSFFQNQRASVFEWAFGRDINATRPMTESDPQHTVSSVGDFEGGELSYPSYLNYDAHDPTNRIEDIHYAGQIVSHYFVALNAQLRNKCVYSTNNTDNIHYANNEILKLLMDTLAELGDITATGTDHNQIIYAGNPNEVEYRRNLNPDHSLDWINMVNPINFRSFFQTFSRKMKQSLIDDTSMTFRSCPLGQLTQDDIESLLDAYGLLLFDTYNENGNSHLRSNQTVVGSTPLGHNGTNDAINPANRVNTEMVSKDSVILDPRSGASTGFVFDDRRQMLGVLENLEGITGKLSDMISNELIHNNGNGQISPGELVGVMPNIYNQSNSIIAGVQLLANDWDHFKGEKPCNNLGDSFPFASEGAADLSSGEGTAGGCDYVTRANGDDSGEELHPICFVQVEKDDVLVWSSQEALRDKIGLDASQCLTSPTNGGATTHTKDCFIRTVEGFQHSWFSRIDPNSSWTDSLKDSNGETEFQQHNLIFMEVNPNTPPGTKFNCRFRARFTNCQDCWHDSEQNEDDFLDFEYSGGEPFQIINFQFRVID